MSTGWALALVVVAAALLAWPPATARSALRARAVVPRPEPPPRDPRAGESRRRWVLAAATGTAVALLVGGWPGVVLGALAAVGAARVLPAGGEGSARDRNRSSARDLPVACDLLAVCLAAGVPVAGALAAVGGAVPAPVGPELTTVAGLYRLGAEPRRAWADVPDALAGLGRVLVRAGESGSSVVVGLRALAADSRVAARADTEAGVRRAGVWILAPLGLCFLPAFVCLGVVPLVLGVAAGVFG